MMELVYRDRQEVLQNEMNTLNKDYDISQQEDLIRIIDRIILLGKDVAKDDDIDNDGEFAIELQKHVKNFKELKQKALEFK
jgi:hypothetical protein